MNSTSHPSLHLAQCNCMICYVMGSHSPVRKMWLVEFVLMWVILWTYFAGVFQGSYCCYCVNIVLITPFSYVSAGNVAWILQNIVVIFLPSNCIVSPVLELQTILWLTIKYTETPVSSFFFLPPPPFPRHSITQECWLHMQLLILECNIWAIQWRFLQR